MLEVRSVTREYRLGEVTVKALDDLSLRIEDGEFVAILGPSGSGKSTLLNLIGLLDVPSSGEVLLDGRDVVHLSDGERARIRLMSIGFVFQRFHLVSAFSAIENVALPLEAAGWPAEARWERAASLLRSVGMADRMLFAPARLSGGQRQRVAICRALANTPRIVLADEPTGQLHSEDKAGIIALFQQLNRAGNTFVVVTHDHEMASAARRIVELRDGKIIREVRT
ncbi:MAG: ABC transporter ATP-binding protein [Dehalococcoidia bacterium]|nr:MAG: ABC transporter ATP-binding protein [Dehalococcoidia bacterium]